MHSQSEAAALSCLAAGSSCVVEIGVYEGSSALLFCDALSPSAQLHLIDPFVDESGWALVAGWRASPRATQIVVQRAARDGGPGIHWHIARSQDVGRSWSGPEVDVVFLDGDHEPGAVREDWEVWHGHVRAGGRAAFHDSRLGRPGGDGSPGPTSVVDDLFRNGSLPDGWSIESELDTLTVVRRTA
jgi:predicted O-methyltransferase YrrM